MATTTLVVRSAAPELGYGNWKFAVHTDPDAPVGTPCTLTMNVGADVVTGTIGSAGAFWHDAIRRVAPGVKTASCTVEGYEPSSAEWTMERLIFSRFELAGRTLTMEGMWCVSGGGPTTASDAEFDYGDGDSETGKAGSASWTRGQITKRHTYPLHPTDRTYTVTLTSGAQTATRTVTVPGTGRVHLVTDSGVTALVDVQAWPEERYERTSAVLAVMGREEPVVLLDSLRDASGTITFLTRTADERSDLYAVLRTVGRIRMLSPCPGVGSPTFVVLSTAAVRLTTVGSDPRRLWPTEIQEVFGGVQE